MESEIKTSKKYISGPSLVNQNIHPVIKYIWLCVIHPSIWKSSSSPNPCSSCHSHIQWSVPPKITNQMRKREKSIKRRRQGENETYQILQETFREKQMRFKSNAWNPISLLPLSSFSIILLSSGISSFFSCYLSFWISWWIEREGEKKETSEKFYWPILRWHLLSLRSVDGHTHCGHSLMHNGEESINTVSTHTHKQTNSQTHHLASHVYLYMFLATYESQYIPTVIHPTKSTVRRWEGT